jgi:hypothetical protein
MPVKKYYKGSGDKVMKEMKERYGEEEGKRVFYATANKRDMNPEDDKKKKSKKRAEKVAAVPDTGRVQESGTKFQYKVLGYMRDGTPLIATVSPSGTVQVVAMKGDSIRGTLYIGEDRKPKWTIPDQGDQEVAQAIERSFLEDPTVHPKWMLEEGRQRMEKASSGSYLDGHLNKAALSLVSQHGTEEEKAQVRAKVHAKFPELGGSEKKAALFHAAYLDGYRRVR